MAVTRINNNQISDASTGNIYVGINAAVKLQNYSVTATKIANNLTYGSDLTITGNLIVQGNTTTIDTTYTTIEDPILLLASNQTGSPSVDIGFVGQRGTSQNIAFVWDESAGEFVTVYTTTGETNTTVGIASYADLHTGNANIGGNTVINGTTSLVGNLIGAVNATGNITGGNLITPGLVTATGNITSTANVAGGNLITGGQVSATGNITSAANVAGGNVIATTTVSASSVIGTTVSASGNVTGGNLVTGGQVTATGNITSAANISGGNISTSGTFSATTLSATTVSASGNITGGNLITGGLVSATGNITSAANIAGGNIVTSGIVTATGNVNAGNLNAATGVTAITGYFTGNVDVLGNLNASVGIVYANSGIFYGDAVTGNNAAFAGIPGFTQLGSNVVMQFAGNVNSYSQINFQNINNGTAASTDYIATADNGNDTSYYVDLGINSSTFNDPSYAGFGPNDAYVHNHGGNLILNPETSGKVIKFMVGGTGNANVIATISETQLSVTGAISATGTVTGGNLATSGTISGAGNITGGNVNTGGLVSATGNVSGGNVNTGGQVSATGTVTGGNLITSGLVSATGNITSTANIAGGNLSVTGAVSAATMSSTGNLFVGGNLTVQGNITYQNVDDLRVEDPVIIMGTGPNGAPLTSDDGMDRGIYMEYYKSGATGNAFVGWDNSSGNIFAATSVNFSANNVVNVIEYGTFQAGNIVAQSASASGNVTGGNLVTGGQVTATGNITSAANISGGNISTAGTFSAGSLSSAGNITGGNLVTSGLVTATGNITSSANVAGGNVIATTTVSAASVLGSVVSASGNVTGGNLITGGLITATGNITSTANVAGGNLLTGGQVSATGNITSSANISGGNVIATTTVSAASLLGSVVSASGNVTGGNLITGGLITATGNITSTANVAGGNVIATTTMTAPTITGTTISASGNISGGNASVSGNITASYYFGNGSQLTGVAASTSGFPVTAGTSNIAAETNGNIGVTVAGTSNVVTFASTGVYVTGVVSASGNITSAANVAGANIIGTNMVASSNITGANLNTGGANGLTLNASTINSNAARITINSNGSDVDFAVDSDATANVFYVDAGTGTASFGSSTQTTNAVVAFNATNSILMPVGNTAQRPSTGVTGMLRFNSTLDAVEVYDTDSWTTVGTPSFTVITDDQFSGDGAQVAYTLADSYTTNSVIVSINGVVQIPTVAYSVSGNALTFTEAPQQGDFIDVRGLTTTTQVTSISNSPGNAVVSTNPTTNEVNITGNLLPVANSTQSLGSQTLRWKDLYVAGNSIYIGNIVMKNTSGNTVAFYGPDGTTPATLDSTNVDTTKIANGTSNLSVIASGGNIQATVGGAAIITIASSGIVNNMGNGIGNIGSSTGYFNTVFAKATSAQYADLAENYTADAKYEPGTVLSFGGADEVTLSTVHGDARIAGVVSTNPSYIMNSTLESEYVATIALTGRVPTKVTGTVHKGDMMISDGNGRAIACATPAIGTVIGKALENHNGGDAVIEVVVGRL